MNKILLTLTILGAGAGGFLTARQSTTQLQRKANTARQAWLVETQLVAVAQSDQAGMIERVVELKQALAQAPAVGENALWFALQVTRAGQLTPELRERLLEELGFNWKSSEDFIVVSKDTVRELQMNAIRDGKLSNLAATVWALTPEERGLVEAAMQRVQVDSKDWVSSHVGRSEPKDDVVAQYTLPPALSISNSFAAGLSDSVGQERAELILAAARNWMLSIGIREEPTTLVVKRYLAGNELRLRFEIFKSFARTNVAQLLMRSDLSSQSTLPEAFRPIFTNGWADVAEREGFELPKEPEKK